MSVHSTVSSIWGNSALWRDLVTCFHPKSWLKPIIQTIPTNDILYPKKSKSGPQKKFLPSRQCRRPLANGYIPHRVNSCFDVSWGKSVPLHFIKPPFRSITDIPAMTLLNIMVFHILLSKFVMSSCNCSLKQKAPQYQIVDQFMVVRLNTVDNGGC